MWDAMLRDVGYSLRGLARRPGFALVAVLTLAIGAGTNTAVFSVVDNVLVKPLPYPNAQELVAIWHDAPGAPGLTAAAGGLNLSPSMFVTYRDENRSFQSIGIWTQATPNVTGLAEPEQLRAALVSGGVLQSYGVAPLLGRWLDERDESPAAAAAVMLGYGYWQRRFGGADDVVGQSITVDGVTTEIVGVMPQGFRFGDLAVDLIASFRLDPARLIPPPFCCFGVARLRPGVSIDSANADLERMLPIWIDRFPFANGATGREVYLEGWRIAPTLRSLKDDVIGTVGDMLWVVTAMIGIVLLIACANVASLMLVRGEQRSLEFGVRAALGAGTWPIARTCLVESLLLAFAGGAVGLLLGYAALQVLVALAPPQLPRLESIVLDERGIAFAAVLSVVAGILVGVAPVLRAARLRLATALHGARGGSTGRVQQRTQSALVVGQVALAIVLLVASGLMIRTFQALRAVEPGFTGPETVQTFQVNMPATLVPDPRDVYRQQRAIVDAIEAIPGVTSAGYVRGLPMDDTVGNWDGLDVEGAQYGVDGQFALRVFRSISPDYFETLGTRIVTGRGLDWVDLDETREVVLVSENLARELWGTPERAVRRRIRPAGGMRVWWEVVGVVEDVRLTGADRAPPAIVYWPGLIEDFYINVPLYVERGVSFAVRTPQAGAPSLMRQIEQAVWSVNPDLPIANPMTMQDLYDRSLARTSFTLVMLALGAAVALVLGVVGLYGVLSYAVSMRRREIAIRLALGALKRDVQLQFVGRGVALAAIGVVIGLLAATAATSLMRALLYDVRAVDPLTYSTVAVGLVLVAVVASFVSTLRITGVDPAESLAAQ